jgi:hypothetical protein
MIVALLLVATRVVALVYLGPVTCPLVLDGPRETEERMPDELEAAPAVVAYSAIGRQRVAVNPS